MSPIRDDMRRTFAATSVGFNKSAIKGSLTKNRNSVPALALPKTNSTARSPAVDEMKTPLNKPSKAKSGNFSSLNMKNSRDFTESRLEQRERELDE